MCRFAALPLPFVIQSEVDRQLRDRFDKMLRTVCVMQSAGCAIDNMTGIASWQERRKNAGADAPI